MNAPVDLRRGNKLGLLFSTAYELRDEIAQLGEPTLIERAELRELAHKFRMFARKLDELAQ